MKGGSANGVKEFFQQIDWNRRIPRLPKERGDSTIAGGKAKNLQEYDNCPERPIKR